MKALSHVDYIREIRADIPQEAFAPAPTKLARMLLYLSIVVAAYISFRFTPSLLLRALLSLLIGHTLACLGFLSHELAHGAVIRARLPRYAWEYFFWA